MSLKYDSPSVMNLLEKERVVGFKVDFSNLEWGTVENKPRGRPEDLERTQRFLERVAITLGGSVHVSRRGRYHIVLTKDSITYSISCSADRGLWYVFYPFPSWGANSEHLSFTTLERMLEYFDER